MAETVYLTRFFNQNYFPCAALPPGPVETLTSMSSTPFSIEVIWEAPIQTPSQQSVCPITGYRLELLDEFNVVLREANSTATKSLFSNLEPNTLYRVGCYSMSYLTFSLSFIFANFKVLVITQRGFHWLKWH